LTSLSGFVTILRSKRRNKKVRLFPSTIELLGKTSITSEQRAMLGLSLEVNTIVNWIISNPVSVQLYLLEENTSKKGGELITSTDEIPTCSTRSTWAAIKGSYSIFYCQFKWSGRGGCLLGKKMLFFFPPKRTAGRQTRNLNNNAKVSH